MPKQLEIWGCEFCPTGLEVTSPHRQLIEQHEHTVHARDCFTRDVNDVLVTLKSLRGRRQAGVRFTDQEKNYWRRWANQLPVAVLSEAQKMLGMTLEVSLLNDHGARG